MKTLMCASRYKEEGRWRDSKNYEWVNRKDRNFDFRDINKDYPINDKNRKPIEDDFDTDWDFGGYPYRPARKKQPCLHRQCSECHGSGRKRNGEMCIHMISCPCPSCTPYCY